MKKRFLKDVSVVVIASVALSACSTNGGLGGMGAKETAGTAIGAGVGGVIGQMFGGGTGRLIATGVGVFVGGMIGNWIGSELDEADRLALAEKTEEAVTSREVGETVTWTNPETGVKVEAKVLQEVNRPATFKPAAAKPAPTPIKKPGAVAQALKATAAKEAKPFCRVVLQTVSAGGETKEQKFGTCLIDGKWVEKDLRQIEV